MQSKAAASQQQPAAGADTGEEKEDGAMAGSLPTRQQSSVPGSSAQPDCDDPEPASDAGGAPSGNPDTRKFELRSSGDEFGGSTSNGSDEGSNEPSAAGGGGGGGSGNQFNPQPGAGADAAKAPTPPSKSPAQEAKAGRQGEGDQKEQHQDKEGKDDGSPRGGC